MKSRRAGLDTAPDRREVGAGEGGGLAVVRSVEAKRLAPAPALRGVVSRAVVLWLLFMALFARGMLPSGTMLAFGADKVSVVLCTAQGALAQALDKNGQPLKSHHGETCPFGFALSMAAAPTMAMPELAQSLASTLSPRIQAQTSSATPRYTYSARAPPRFV